MNDDSSFQFVATVVAWISGAALSAVSFMRAAIAAASAMRLEQLHAQYPSLLDAIYDARRLGSAERTVLMLFDVTSVALLVASLSALVVLWYDIAVYRIAGLVLVIVGVVMSKAAIHIVGDLLADAAVLTVARWFRAMTTIVRPLVVIVEAVLCRIHTQRHSEEEAREHVAEELTAIMEEAVEEGTLEAGEARLLQNIMRVGEVRVEDVMTPRNVVASLHADVPIAEAARAPELQTYSRLPVWEGVSIDNVIGYVLSRDVLVHALVGDGSQPVRVLVRPVVFIPENVGLDRALEEFLTRRQHMFVVVDEYGGVEGIITLEDVVETILGAEIVDEADRVVDMRQLAQQQRDRRIAQQQLAVGQSHSQQ
ncbi:MAG: CBS domain-containing protein [Chlorobi bacterium]|nr:CBS domain-containing protein [Chlorobiota bacterium]